MPDLYQQVVDFIRQEKARLNLGLLDGLDLSEAGQIFADCMRFLVQTAEQFNKSGMQKKEIVMDALDKAYDLLLVPALPWWLRSNLVKKVLMILAGGIVESFVDELPK